MAEMEGELKTAILKTVRKVNTMKAQFQDHKRKWGAVSWYGVKLTVKLGRQTCRRNNELEYCLFVRPRS